MWSGRPLATSLGNTIATLRCRAHCNCQLEFWGVKPIAGRPHIATPSTCKPSRLGADTFMLRGNNLCAVHSVCQSNGPSSCHDRVVCHPSATSAALLARAAVTEPLRRRLLSHHYQLCRTAYGTSQTCNATDCAHPAASSSRPLANLSGRGSLLFSICLHLMVCPTTPCRHPRHHHPQHCTQRS